MLRLPEVELTVVGGHDGICHTDSLAMVATERAVLPLAMYMANAMNEMPSAELVSW
jgi:hypothetical protein